MNAEIGEQIGSVTVNGPYRIERRGEKCGVAWKGGKDWECFGRVVVQPKTFQTDLC